MWTHAPASIFEQAALSLRALLAHASLWIGTTSVSDPRVDRRLSCQEIQSLRSHFELNPTPEYRPDCELSLPPLPPGMRYPDRYKKDSSPPVEHYLPWLAEDAALAQQVADTWNEVVGRGEAALVSCRCEKCRTAQ